MWADPGLYRTLAALVLLAHLAFIGFVLLGGLLTLRWPRAAWVHLPAALWGAATELFQWPCPLTPLEKHFLRLAGETPYTGDFIARYLFPLIYPAGLTPTIQITLGVFVITLNAVLYGWLLARRRRR